MPSSHQSSHPWRVARLAAGVLTFAVVVSTVVALAPRAGADQLTPEVRLATEVAAAVNAERQARGLDPLPVTGFDTEFAQEIAERRRHGCSPGSCHSSTADRAVYAGPPYFVGENFALGWFTSGRVTRAWMESTSHREVILLGNVDRMGVGVACRGDGAMAVILVMAASSNEVATRPLHPAGTSPSPVKSADSGLDCGTAHRARTLDRGCPGATVVEDGFSDVAASSVHEYAIDCIVSRDLAAGVSPDLFAPARAVTRGQMATFIVRLLDAAGVEGPDGTDAFADDDGHVHETSIDRLAALGVVTGRADGTFGPDLTVTRAQMATFLDRAVELVQGSKAPYRGSFFLDHAGSPHRESIDRMAAAGVLTGTAPVTYAPHAPVTRAQMGSFLARTVDLLVAGGHLS